MSLKIDFVIPWVDGTDSEWLKERLKHSSSEKDYVESQYRDWDILKYWFRGVEEFAPWVNKIYFITWGHIPPFLNINHPKLVVVNHRDFIPDKYLPTFSANVIETNIHRIKGLSEHFVYFNDDVFIMKSVFKEQFFKNGVPCDSAVMKPIEPARYDSIASMMVNNIAIVNENFSKRESIRNNKFKWFNFKYGVLIILNIMFIPWARFVGLYEQHVANSYRKSTFFEVWEQEKEILDATGNNKIRNFKTDVNQWLFKNWRIAKGDFVPRKISFGKYLMVDSVDKAKQVAKHLKKQTHSIICVNDHYNGESLDKVIDIIQGGFNSVLKNKSHFEI